MFFLAGTVGLLRFPDTMTRLHALTKVDNLGLGLIVLALLPRTSDRIDRCAEAGPASGCSFSCRAPSSPSCSPAPLGQGHLTTRAKRMNTSGVRCRSPCPV